MKKISILLVIVMLLSLAACTVSDSNSESDTVPSSSLSEPEVSSPDLESESENSESPVYDEVAIREDFEQVVAGCKDVIDSFEIDLEKAAYPLPTLEEYTRMCDAIGSLGFPAYYYDLDMPNHEVVESFYADVQAGKDAYTVIYCLYNVGIYADVLMQHEGKLYQKTVVYYFPDLLKGKETTIDFNASPVYKIEDLRMTDKGYLLYQIPEQDGYSEMFGGYRISPLGEELRELTRNYLRGLGYIASGLLRYDWDGGDYTNLNMNLVFESLYYRQHMEFPPTLYTEQDGDNRTLIPAEVMEDIMLEGLPLTKDELRTYIPFIETENAYAYRPFEGGGYSPVPEIVAITENADGSISLTVDAVSVEFGEDKSMSSVLTVMENPDGSIKYLSNKVIEPFK